MHEIATLEPVPWDEAAGVGGTNEPPDERIADDALDDVLCAAAERDAIARAILDVASRRAARVGLFAAGRDGVRGVAGRGRGFETAAVTRIELPPEGGTIFDTALRSRDFYFGIVPPLPPNRDLYTALGGRLPRNVLLVPIRVKDRTIAILYMDNDAESMPDPDIGLIRRVAAKAGLAFEMLLLRSKLRSI